MSISPSLPASLKYLVLSTLVIAVAPVTRCQCEELKDLLARVQKFADEKNYPKAIDELNWVQKELQKRNGQELKRFFPDEVKGFKGDKLKVSTALGFSQVERVYAEGERTISLSLTGGSAAGGLGNLAQLGQFAALAGSQPGQETLRIQGRTAQLEGDEESQYNLSIFLESGSVLKLDASEGISSSQLKEFAESLMLEQLDKYMKG